jgi:AraC-like DNA-binding protein
MISLLNPLFTTLVGMNILIRLLRCIVKIGKKHFIDPSVEGTTLIHTKIKPRILNRYIKYFYVLKSERAHIPAQSQRYLPDGNMELLVNLGAPVIHSDLEKGTFPMPQALVGGLHEANFSLQYTGEVYLAGAFIKPGAATVLLNDRTETYKKAFAPADVVFRRGVARLIEQLRKVSSPTEIAGLLESFLAPKFLSCDEPRYFVNIQRAVEMIEDSNGGVSLKNLHEMTYMSERNFRGIFTEYVGFSPKEYARIIRAKRVFSLLRSGIPIFDVAFQLGYYDPAHLSKDFAGISGIPPSEFLGRVNSIDLQY